MLVALSQEDVACVRSVYSWLAFIGFRVYSDAGWFSGFKAQGLL